MKIRINGEEKTISGNLSLTVILKNELNGSEPKGVAVAVNSRVVPKQKWENTIIHENDEIEIVKAVQGG